MLSRNGKIITKYLITSGKIALRIGFLKLLDRYIDRSIDINFYPGYPRQFLLNCYQLAYHARLGNPLVPPALLSN